MTAETETLKRPTTPYERLGGSEVLRAIVNRFYDAMEKDPALAELRAMHAPDLAPMRESLSGFLTGWTGGPRDWFGAGKCVMGLHRPLAITAESTDQWVTAIRKAIDDTVKDSDPELAKAFGDTLEQMALGMVNRSAAG